MVAEYTVKHGSVNVSLNAHDGSALCVTHIASHTLPHTLCVTPNSVATPTHSLCLTHSSSLTHSTSLTYSLPSLSHISRFLTHFASTHTLPHSSGMYWD
jgi:hypothetical protein